MEAGSDPFITNNDGRKPSDLTSSDTIKQYLLDEESKIIKLKAKAAIKEKEEAPVVKKSAKKERKIKVTKPATPKANTALRPNEFLFGQESKKPQVKKIETPPLVKVLSPVTIHTIEVMDIDSL